MKAFKIGILMFLAIVLIQSVLAINTGVVIEFPDGTSTETCVAVRSGGSAIDAIRGIPNLADKWEGSPMELIEVDDIVNNDESNGKYWTLFHNNGEDSEFNISTEDWDDYTITEEGHVIGISYTDDTSEIKSYFTVVDAYSTAHSMQVVSVSGGNAVFKNLGTGNTYTKAFNNDGIFYEVDLGQLGAYKISMHPITKVVSVKSYTLNRAVELTEGQSFNPSINSIAYELNVTSVPDSTSCVIEIDETAYTYAVGSAATNNGLRLKVSEVDETQKTCMVEIYEYGNAVQGTTETVTYPTTQPTFESYSELCPEMLKFNEIEILVDGDDETGAGLSGGIINNDVEPESEIKIDIKLENKYVDDDDEIAISGVFAKAVLENIDDGDDIEVESDEIEIGPEDEEELSVKLQIPLIVQEDTYELILTVYGEDDNGLTYEKRIEFDVDIQKERHAVKITKAELSPETVTCFRRANVDVEITNIGKKDEDVSLLISSIDLAIDHYTNFSLDRDPKDSDNDYNNDFNFDIADDVALGSYPISVKIQYEKDKKSEEQVLNLLIDDCDERTSRSARADRTSRGDVQEDPVEVIVKEQSEEVEEEKMDMMPLTVGISAGVIMLAVAAVIVFLIIKIVKR